MIYCTTDAAMTINLIYCAALNYDNLKLSNDRDTISPLEDVAFN